MANAAGMGLVKLGIRGMTRDSALTSETCDPSVRAILELHRKNVDLATLGDVFGTNK